MTPRITFEQRRAEIMKTSRRDINEENWEFTTKAAENEFNDLITRQRMAVLEAPPGAGYRSTPQMEAVRDYTVVVRKAFDLRLDKLKEVH